MCMALSGVTNSVVNEEGTVTVTDDTVINELRNVVELYLDQTEELSMTVVVYMLGFNTYTGFGKRIQQKLGSDNNSMLKRIYEYARRLQ